MLRINSIVNLDSSFKALAYPVVVSPVINRFADEMWVIPRNRSLPGFHHRHSPVFWPGVSDLAVNCAVSPFLGLTDSLSCRAVVAITAQAAARDSRGRNDVFVPGIPC